MPLLRHDAATFLAGFRFFTEIRMFVDRQTGCFWQDGTRLRRYAFRMNTTWAYACVHAFPCPASLHMTASLPLSFPLLLPPPLPPVIRLFTGTTPTHSLAPGINTEPWQEQESLRPIHSPSLNVRLAGGYVTMIMIMVPFATGCCRLGLLAEFVECPIFTVQGSPSRLFSPNSIIAAVLCHIVS